MIDIKIFGIRLLTQVRKQRRGLDMCEVYMYIYNGIWRQMVLYITRDSYDNSIQAYLTHHIGVCIIPVHMYIHVCMRLHMCI